jgi:hypothetical protein
MFVISALVILVAIFGLLETCLGVREKFEAGAKNG